MGKSYSKTEEIVIAQNGANSASTSSLEQKIEMYGITIITILIILFLIALTCVYKNCNKGVRKWARKELAAVSLSQVDKAGQPTANPATMHYA